MTLKFKRLFDDVILPVRASKQSCGLDICAYTKESITISVGESIFVHTGLTVEIPEGYGGFVFARSGLSCKHGLVLGNSVGVIDSDYRGEIKICLRNLGQNDYTISPNERIAQLVIIPTPYFDVVDANELSDTDRGSNGFGSTGRV